MDRPLGYCLFLTLLVQVFSVQAQTGSSDPVGYACSDGPSLCHTLVVYRAQAPHYLTMDSISELFGVSKLVIARDSNLVNEDTELIHGQPLLVPITCGCMGNVSQANVTYQIIRGDDDTLYSISTSIFQNLTTHQAAVSANPEVDPYNLLNGTEVVMPIRCGCPTKAQLEKNISMLITYMLHEDDSLANIIRTFNVDFQELVDGSEPMALSNSSTVLMPVSRRPLLSHRLSHVSPSVVPVIPTPTSSKADSSQPLLLGLYIALLGMLVLRLAFEIRHKFSKIEKASRLEEKLLSWPKSKSVDIEMGVQPEHLGDGEWECSDKPIMYSPYVIKEATQNFSPMFHIEGSVYRGIINGRMFAIKRIKDVPQELKSLKKVKHENLVNLEGICMTSEGKSYLIYEYVENSSLNLWLHNRPSSVLKMGFTRLTWRTRLQIALDVATGLKYIHEHTGIVHGDLKSSHVLLNSKLRAKIANFAVASSGMNAATKHVKGTDGYIAPEYGVGVLLSPNIDVFAYGVILLELISGKEATVKDDREVRLVWTQIKALLEGHDREEKLRNWIDPNVQNTCSIHSVVSLALMAKACLEGEVRARPTIAEIVSKLSDLLDVCFEHLEC